MLDVLIDTNIAVDYALGREPWFTPAKRIMEAACDGRIQLVLPATSLKDVYYLVSKQIGLSSAGEMMDYLMDVCEIGGVCEETCRQARLEPETDFEDGIVAAVAREQMVDIIISRDKEAFNHLPAAKMDSRVFVEFFLSARGDTVFYETDGMDSRCIGDLD